MLLERALRADVRVSFNIFNMSHVNCSVYGCYSTPKINRALRFHRFPRDARNQLWIDACRRPDLKNKSVDQLYSMYVCGLHFEKWMYMKRKLKSTAIPTLNIPSASMFSVSTQTEMPVLEITIDLHSGGVQRQIDAHTIGASAVASSPAQTSQITQEMTYSILRKRLREETESSAKKLKLTEDNSTKLTRQQFLQGCDKFLSPSLSTIAKAQANLEHPSKNNRYSKAFKLFCLNIYCSSPYAYKFLSKTLCLPPKRTLATLPIPVGTKISHYIWGVLSQVIKRLSPFDRECIFCMDVMSLNRSLFYNTHKDKINGLHEIDGIQSPYAAGYALTVMLKGILGDWKQLVGYALTTTKEIDEPLEKWIVNTIKQLFILGFKIRAVVSDQESCLYRRVSKDNPYFEIDGKKIYYIYDVPHLIKSVRNNLMKYNFEFSGKTASWDDIYKCYQLDKQKSYRCAPKLTDAHVSPKKFQEQKLRLATQVFSNSVKTAVETYTKAGDLNPCDGTVEFIDTMDKLIDLLNSSTLFSPKPYNQPYRDNELQRNLLLKAQNLLSSLKVKQKTTGKDVTTSMKFIEAFSVTINAFIQLYYDLKKESQVGGVYLLTGRLNNDSVESFFNVIRQAGGNCRQPKCGQFERAFRKCFLWQILKLCSERNCANDFDNILKQFGDFTQSESIFTTRASRSLPTKFDIPDHNSYLYICGYIWRRCLDRHKCLGIINYATSYTAKPISNLYSRESAFGALRVGSSVPPPAKFIIYCNELEVQFTQNFRSFAGNKIFSNLFGLLKTVEYKSRPCTCFPICFVVKLFIRMRIHYILKFNNRNLIAYKNKASRKYFALQLI